MATFDYQGMQDVAQSLLELFGGDAVLSRKTASTYSPSATPENTSIVAPTTFNATIAIVPEEDSYLDGKKYEWNDEYHGGTSVKSTDARAFMYPVDTVSGANLDPQIGDTFTFENSRTYTIKTVSRIDPSGSLNCLFVMDISD
jgi:hypothetical protein